MSKFQFFSEVFHNFSLSCISQINKNWLLKVTVKYESFENVNIKQGNFMVLQPPVFTVP